ncbi:hypothetical protein [Phyllobacterium sp. SB3]|uniref:hypothetical protein n=1 Tax=Phyllobacterium sp. SB3 TaxID=3156073 RepID=UPI0032AF59E5
MLPGILAGVRSARRAYQRRRREDEEQARRDRDAEARRWDEEAFNSREKRRMEFVDAVHEQLTQCLKLATVLAHHLCR